MGRAMHGWIVIDKPLGLGSTDAVSAVKRALRSGDYPRRKVGHGGTLDPLATGVLPIAVGEATKLAGRMLDSDKIYRFTVRFGVETDSLDAEGSETATSPVRPTVAQARAVLARFTGPIEQVPPVFSALKVDGARAYALARAGEEVTLAPRAVTIHALTLDSATPHVPGDAGSAADALSADALPADMALEDATFTAHVSKGTYIRSLARDIAHALGTVGHVALLRREKAGPFGLENAISLDKLADAAKERRLEELFLPLRAGLDDIPALSLSPDQAGRLRAGQQLVGIAAGDGPAFAMLDDVPVALVEVSDGNVRVVRGFNLD